MKERRSLATLVSVTALALVAVLPRAAAAEGQHELITPAFKAVSDAYDPKHTPKITAPEKVKAGEWFDVTVEIGQGSRHPTMIEHHVRWIAIFKNDVELARTYLHPVHTSPKVTYTIALEESAELVAMEEPTHSAAWKSSVKIEVEPPPADEE